MTDPARAIAEFATRLDNRFDAHALPALAIERANLAFIDSLGVMLAGSRTEPAEIVAHMVRDEAAAARATIAGRALKTSPQLAALANGVALHALDYDITTTGGQPTAGLVPAILAVAEAQGSTPAEAFRAYIIGFEVALRLLRACPEFATGVGWHPTGMVGTIAATVACLRLLRADADAVVRGVGISASLASSLTVNFGTMTKPLHAGQAARNGVMAATLAMRGFTSSPVALTAHNGYFADVCRGFEWSPEVFADFGTRWDIVEVGFKVKPYACGGLGHTAIDAALAVRAALEGNAERISAVHVGVTNQAARHVKTTYPTTIESSKFSVPYVIATAFVHGAPRLSSFTEAAIADPAVRAFAQKITAAPDPEFGDSVDPNPARVVATLTDGTRVEMLIEYALGSTRVPMSPTQIEAKFLDCAGPVLDPETARQTFATWRNLNRQSSFSALWPTLRGKELVTVR